MLVPDNNLMDEVTVGANGSNLALPLSHAPIVATTEAIQPQAGPSMPSGSTESHVLEAPVPRSDSGTAPSDLPAPSLPSSEVPPLSRLPISSTLHPLDLIPLTAIAQ